MRRWDENGEINKAAPFRAASNSIRLADWRRARSAWLFSPRSTRRSLRKTFKLRVLLGIARHCAASPSVASGRASVALFAVQIGFLRLERMPRRYSPISC